MVAAAAALSEMGYFYLFSGVAGRAEVRFFADPSLVSFNRSAVGVRSPRLSFKQILPPCLCRFLYCFLVFCCTCL